MTPSDVGTIDFPGSGNRPDKDESAEGGLFGEIRALALERIPAGAAKGLDKVIDELYDLAEHALERDSRDFYLEAKDRWPRQRAALETGFKEHLSKRFVRKSAATETKRAEFSQTKTSWSELSLVDDGVLEEDMRFTEIAGRIRNGADEELAALDQRMSVLLDIPDLPTDDNPLAPSGIAGALREALSGIELDIKIKMIVIRAFDEGARPEIIKLYKDVNTLLKDKGVLPTVRYGAAKKPLSGSGPTSGPRTDGGGPQVVGSVTLPIMSGAGAGGATLTVGAGMPVGVAMPMAGGAAAGGMPMATMNLPGGLPAGAAGAPAAAGGAAPAAAGGEAGLSIPGVAMAAPAAGAMPAAEGMGDPFAMLQQLLMMNLAAGRSPVGAVPGGPAAAQYPGAAGPAGAPAGWSGTAPPAAPGEFPSLNLEGGAPGAVPGGAFPGAGPGAGGFPGVPGAGPAGSGVPGGAYPGGGFPGGPGGFGGPGGAGGGPGGGGYPGGGQGGYTPGAPPGAGMGPGGTGGYPAEGGQAGGPAAFREGGFGPGGGGGNNGSIPGGTGNVAGGGPGGPGPGGGGYGGGAGGAAYPGGGGQGGGYPGGGGQGGGYPGGSGQGGGYPGGGSTTPWTGEGPAPGSTGEGYGLPGVPGGPGVVTPAGFPTPPGTGPHAIPGGPGGTNATNTFGTLAGLAAAAGNQAGNTRSFTVSGGAFMPGNLVGSLTKLQQGDIGAFPDVPPEVGAWLASRQSSLPVDDFIPPTPNVLRALKSSSLGQQMGQMDTVTLDIVSMLFDQIFGDARIAPAMKALIGRLQIPMLKVAVLDKTFFSRKAHPARHMLDTLGELSMGLGEGFGPGTPLYQKIEATLTRLIEQFEEDFGVFDRITVELEAMIAELNQKADQVGKSESKRILDKERLEVARLFAQNEMKARIEGHELPRAVLRFLSTEWMKLLILAYAKGGRESRAWTSLVETLDILVWSLTPKHKVEERKRLVSILPGLLKRLSKGMEVIGTDRLVRERFNAVLMRCHSRAIAGGSVTDLFQRSQAPAPSQPRPVPTPSAEALAGSDGDPARQATGQTPWPVSPDLSLSGLSSAPPPPAESGDGSMIVEEVPMEFGGSGQAADGEFHDITRPMPESGVPPDITLSPVSINVTEPLPMHEEMSAEPAPETFPAVKVKNPFGEGEIEVEEVSFNDLPGFFSGGAAASQAPAGPVDEFSEKASRLAEGDWVEIHQEGKEAVQARLSFISPYRSTFVFSNRKGQKVAEYSSYQVTSYLRSGRLLILEGTPLFDRAFGNLVNILRKGAEAA